MLMEHLVIVVTLSTLFTVMAFLQKKDATPILPALAFISWLGAAYQSLAVEIPYSYGDPAIVKIFTYAGGSSLSIYFLGLAGVMLIYTLLDTYRLTKKVK